jgi:transposase
MATQLLRFTMNFDWLADGRKIPDDVMFYVRVMAVNAIRILGQSPEAIAKAYNFNRACIYRWLRQYDEGGFAALKSEMPPGAKPPITGEMDEWLKQTVLEETPVSFGYDTNLWTCAILSDLLKHEFGATVSDSAVRLHLKKLGLSFQKPEYQDAKRDDEEIEYFLNVKFPKIQRLAIKLGADIGFQDESGVGIMTRYGRTWGLRGQTPVIDVSMKRGGYNVLSVITAQGKMRYSVKTGRINGEVFIEFLKHLIAKQVRPLILLVDHATFHSSKLVRDFVRSHRAQLRIFFLPKRAPEFNPDEQVWNEIKKNRIGKQPVKDKEDLKKRLFFVLSSLQKNTKKVISFFQLPDTRYASQCES